MACRGGCLGKLLLLGQDFADTCQQIEQVLLDCALQEYDSSAVLGILGQL
jgi:hypothetical protein